MSVFPERPPEPCLCCVESLASCLRLLVDSSRLNFKCHSAVTRRSHSRPGRLNIQDSHRPWAQQTTHTTRYIIQTWPQMPCHNTASRTVVRK